MPKTILLAGAPNIDQISKNLTINHWLFPFHYLLEQQFPEKNHESEKPQSSGGASTSSLPAWRVVPLKQAHLSTGWSQRGWLFETFAGPEIRGQRVHGDNEVLFLSATSPRFSHDAEMSTEDPLSQFIEHSFALHDEAHSSQITAAESQQATVTPHEYHRRIMFSTTGSLSSADIDTSFALSTFPEQPPSGMTPSTFHAPYSTTESLPDYNVLTTPTQAQHVLSAPYLHDLSALPTAAYLSSIGIQTKTVDLIAGIISISPSRTVHIRRTGRQIDVIEILVGDDTRAGFGITFWVASPDKSQGEGQSFVGKGNPGCGMADPMRKMLEGLRTGDVVLLRNVALSLFKGVVYGQSLGRKAGLRSETQVQLMHRLGFHGRGQAYVNESWVGQELVPAFHEDELREGKGVVMAKIGLVREWVRRFVGPVDVGEAGKTKGFGGKERKMLRDDLPPDDTQ